MADTDNFSEIINDNQKRTRFLHNLSMYVHAYKFMTTIYALVFGLQIRQQAYMRVRIYVYVYVFEYACTYVVMYMYIIIFHYHIKNVECQTICQVNVKSCTSYIRMYVHIREILSC